MTGMFSIIWWVIIIMLLVSVKSKKRNGSGGGSGKTSPTGGKADFSGQGRAVDSVQKARAEKAAPDTFTYARQDRIKADSGPQKPADTPDPDSTTGYLRQKAEQDELEHQREDRQEAARLKRESGGKIPALRHFEGDSMPEGKRCVRCSYCGAENLLPAGRSGETYTCYFCREDL